MIKSDNFFTFSQSFRSRLRTSSSVENVSKNTGKSQGKDQQQDKLTYVKYMSKEEIKKEICEIKKQIYELAKVSLKKNSRDLIILCDTFF